MADPVADLHRRLDDPVSVHVEECQRIGLQESAGIVAHGVDHTIWFLRNLEAIRMLQEAERFECKDRSAVLLEFYGQLDPEALPVDFDRRLLLVIANTKGRVGAGIKDARNEKVRRAFDILISNEAAEIAREQDRHPHQRMTAYQYLAKHFGLSIATVRTACGYESVSMSRDDDFRRLTEKRQLQISKANF